MPNITFTVSAENLTRIVNAMCEINGYQDTIDGVANPETKNQFALRTLRTYIKEKVVDYEKNKNVLDAMQSYEASIVPPEIN